MSGVYRNPRPLLSVERAGGGKLGNCYHANTFRITSLRALDMAALKALRETGVIGYGQEFHVRGQLVEGGFIPVPAKLEWQDRMRAPTGFDEVECTEEDGSPALNHLKERYLPIKEPYYVYVTEDRVDSSD